MLLEMLESRRLRSVSVAETYPGYFVIQGDDSANAINIQVSQTNETFTLDGVTYANVWYIAVQGNGGDDAISVISQDGTGYIGAAIDGGAGDDTISLNFDGAVWGGSGNDILNLSDSFRGEVYGNEGNDQIFVRGACVDAQIEGDDGNDLIDCSGNDYSVIVHGGAGRDTIIGSEYDDQLYGDEGEDYVYGRGGNDAFYYTTGDHIDGGDGYDIVYGGTPASVFNVEQVIT